MDRSDPVFPEGSQGISGTIAASEFEEIPSFGPGGDQGGAGFSPAPVVKKGGDGTDAVGHGVGVLPPVSVQVHTIAQLNGGDLLDAPHGSGERAPELQDIEPVLPCQDQQLFQFVPEESLFPVGMEGQGHQGVPDRVFVAVEAELALDPDEGGNDFGGDVVAAGSEGEPSALFSHELPPQGDAFGDQDLVFVTAPAEIGATHLVTPLISGEGLALMPGPFEQAVELLLVEAIFGVHLFYEGFGGGEAGIVDGLCLERKENKNEK